MSVELDKKQRTRHFDYVQQVVEEASHQERASVLHEDMAQLLAAMRLHLSSLHRIDSGSASFGNRLLVLDELIGNAFVLLRQIAIELYPLGTDGNGLYSAMRALVRSLSERHGVNCKLIADESELDIGKSRGVTVFRIAQCALEAIIQWGQIDDVLIKLRVRQDKVVLTIDCQRGRKSEHGRRRSANGLLDKLRAQVKESGGKMRVTRIERGERLEMSLPRYSADLQ